MKTELLLALGVAFIVSGLVFCLLAYFVSRPKTIEEARISKPSSATFYFIGALTFVIGLLAVLFRYDLTKLAMQIGALVYFALISAAFFFFSMIVKDSYSHGRHYSQR